MKTATFILTGLIWFSTIVLGAGEPRNTAVNKAAATIFPVADLVKRVGGEKIEIITILPAGANPHTFELTPRAIKKLKGVRVVFMIGHDFDGWVRAIGESLPEVKIVTVDEGINFIGAPEEDPHYWLSIANGKIIAENITRALTELDPDNGDEYQTNLDLFLTKLDNADRDIHKMLLNFPTRKAVTFHDGWRYFARDYGLEIVGNVESSEGSEPTPKQLVRLAEVVRAALTAPFQVRGGLGKAAMPVRNSKSLLLGFVPWSANTGVSTVRVLIKITCFWRFVTATGDSPDLSRMKTPVRSSLNWSASLRSFA